MDKLDVAQPEIAQLARWLKIIAEPRRLQILSMLMDGLQCNCDLGDYLDMAPNLISHHMSVLRKAGLVDAERDREDARWVYYTINPAALSALNAAFGAFFDPGRIRPRRSVCDSQGSLIRAEDIPAAPPISC